MAVTINGTNDSPVISINTGMAVDEGSTGNVITSAMLNEADPDDDDVELTYQITTATANGTIRLDGTALGVNDTFTQDDIDTGRVTYDHDGSETVSDSFAFTLSDGGEDGAISDSGTFNITVTPVNDAPTLTSFAAVADTTNEDTQVEITFAELTAQGDEADVDGTVDAFVVKSVTSGTLKIGTSAATATAWASGTNDTIDGTNHAYWTPALNANGTLDAFAVVAQDNLGAESTGNVTVQVSVTPVNDLPTIGGTDTGAVTEDVDPDIDGLLETAGSLTISDPDSGESSFQAGTINGTYGDLTIDAATGVVSVAGALDYESSINHSITIRASSTDGSFSVRAFTISVIDLNDNAPVITPGQTLGVREDAANGTSVGTAVATDVDTVGSLQGWAILGGNTDGIFAIDSATGEITITDNTNLDYETTPVYTLTLTVSDGVNSSAPETVTINITVTPVNDAPVASDALFAIDEHSPVGTPVGTAPASDVDAGDVLSYGSLAAAEAACSGSIRPRAKSWSSILTYWSMSQIRLLTFRSRSKIRPARRIRHP